MTTPPADRPPLGMVTQAYPLSIDEATAREHFLRKFGYRAAQVWHADNMLRLGPVVPTEVQLFDDTPTLPLFSGTAPRGHVETFDPPPAQNQDRLF